MTRSSTSILVADDEEHLRSLIKTLLEDAGYSVVLVKNGNEARAALLTQSFDILLTDLVMGGSDGLTLIGDVKKKHPKIQIVAMSGGGFVPLEQYLQIAKNAGARVTLSKPFTKASLLAAIAQATR